MNAIPHKTNERHPWDPELRRGFVHDCIIKFPHRNGSFSVFMSLGAEGNHRLVISVFDPQHPKDLTLFESESMEYLDQGVLVSHISADGKEKKRLLTPVEVNEINQWKPLDDHPLNKECFVRDHWGRMGFGMWQKREHFKGMSIVWVPQSGDMTLIPLEWHEATPEVPVEALNAQGEPAVLRAHDPDFVPREVIHALKGGRA